MPQINLNSAASRLKPMVEYVKKQRENESFLNTVELNATIFLIIFFAIFAIRPTVVTISSLVGEIKAKEVEKTQLKNKINQIVRAQDLYSQVQARYYLIDQSLPDNPQFYNASVQLSQSAAHSSTILDDLSFLFTQVKNHPNAVEHLKNYSIPVSINGSFSQTSQFLSNLLANRRIFKISGVSYSLPTEKTSVGSSDTSQPSAGEINLTLNTNVLYWEDKP